MSLEFTEKNGGRVVCVRVSGKLTKADYERLVPEIERQIDAYGKIRVLFEMHDFHGWQMGALWKDIKFDAKHFSDIERVAMVGERKWQEWMSAFCRPFTTAKIRYFDADEVDQARAWLHED